jgi:trimethylamine--corrinoid protein Co-methyltransferase
LEVIAEAGPGGEFITHPHTFDHFRSVWYPNLLFRGGDEAWKASQQEDFARRVNARTRDLIENHQPARLPADVADAIREILADAR